MTNPIHLLYNVAVLFSKTLKSEPKIVPSTIGNFNHLVGFRCICTSLDKINQHGANSFLSQISEGTSINAHINRSIHTDMQYICIDHYQYFYIKKYINNEFFFLSLKICIHEMI